MQTRYELTKILLELQKEGLPRNTGINISNEDYENIIINWYDYITLQTKGELGKYVVSYIQEFLHGTKTQSYHYENFAEAIEKLKTLLKQKENND